MLSCMDGMDRIAVPRGGIVWSPLLLMVGLALQIALLTLAFVFMLSVPALTYATLESAQSLFGTVAWLNALASFIATLLSLFIVRRHFRSICLAIVNSVVPAVVVSAANIIPTYTLRSWSSIVVSIVLAAVAAIVASLVYIFLLRRKDYF